MYDGPTLKLHSFTLYCAYISDVFFKLLASTVFIIVLFNRFVSTRDVPNNSIADCVSDSVDSVDLSTAP